jgi:PHD/YefM family antitoxin component YafN of YafNO toxin-antitoxin module
MFKVRDLQRHYKTAVETAKRTKDAVLLLNKSKPEAVLLDVETYNGLVEDDYVFDEQKTLRLVKQARQSYQKGRAKRLHTWDDLDR